MKKIILATFLVASISATAFAAGNSNPSIPMPVKLLKTVDSVVISTTSGTGATAVVTCDAPNSANNTTSNWVCTNASGSTIVVSQVVITGGGTKHGYTETCTASSTSTHTVGFNCSRANSSSSSQ